MKIAIDIGHCSFGDQGAVSASGLAEHAYWASHVQAIKDELVRNGFVCQIFRREDYGKSVLRETAAINAWQAAVAISLHLNFSDNPAACGHEVIFCPNSKRGEHLAWLINQELTRLSYTKNRGAKPPFSGRGETFLRKTKSPSAIVEAGFLSNPNDVAALQNLAPQIAKAIAKGVIEFFS